MIILYMLYVRIYLGLSDITSRMWEDLDLTKIQKYQYYTTHSTYVITKYVAWYLVLYCLQYLLKAPAYPVVTVDLLYLSGL
jgi:hypothetical protein